MSPKQEKHEWEFPHLREAHQIPVLATRAGSISETTLDSDLWSVKFYPYSPLGAVPIFAVVGSEYILICRTPTESGKSMEVISSIKDNDPRNSNFVCAWAKDVETEAPLLCVGGKSGAIKVVNTSTGKLFITLTGHGGDIEDLQVSPINPQILASASEDSTIRIWTLEPVHAKRPCIAILAGDGHQETILSLSFHTNGRYLLSAGIDRIINLWVLPLFPDENTGTVKPTQIHYPHFSTSEVHSNIVDCVWFYGDLILSKAESEEHITLWSITGFSSSNPPPTTSSAPTIHDGTHDTRSVFTTSSTPWARLLQFSIPDSSIMFTRFSVFPGSPSKNPVLAFCSCFSKVFFWDLARLENYHSYSSSYFSSSDQAEKPPKRPPYLIPFRHRTRGGGTVSALSRVRDTSPSSSASSHSHPSNSNHGSLAATNPLVGTTEKPLEGRELVKSREIWAKRYDLGDPWVDLAPHKEEVVKGLDFTGRQVAWSMGGEWCVVVGSSGVLAMFERWGKT